MARTVEIERAGEGFKVSWMQGIQPVQFRLFDLLENAERFAYKKMGARGCIISTLEMSTDQLAVLEARKARAAAFMEQFK